jgi:putative transposase
MPWRWPSGHPAVKSAISLSIIPTGVSQYTSIRYAERLGEISAVRSFGRKGDSYDNTAAESLNSLYKKELIEREGPWAGTADVMLATLEWVTWYSRERLHSACEYVPPEEFEESYYAHQENLVS